MESVDRLEMTLRKQRLMETMEAVLPLAKRPDGFLHSEEGRSALSKLLAKKRPFQSATRRQVCRKNHRCYCCRWQQVKPGGSGSTGSP